MAPTSSQVILAANDIDLRERISAVASINGISTLDIASITWEIIAQEILINGNTVSIATAYDYAYNVRKEYVDSTPPLPGKNPSAVTDEIILAALRARLPE